MKFDDIHLAGVGTYLPRTITTEYAVKEGWYAKEAREASGLEAVAVEDTLPAVDMAVRAARTAVDRSGHAADDFLGLLHSHTYYQGPEGWSPAHYILGNTLDRPVSAFQVQHGCLGLLAALESAALRLTTDGGRDAAMLLTAADNFNTPLVGRWTSSSMFVLADSGSSLVVSRRGGFARLLAMDFVSQPGMEAMHRGDEPLFPPREPVRPVMDFEGRLESWRTRWAEGGSIPLADFGALIAATVERTLATAGTSLDRIARVVHNGFNQDPLNVFLLDPLGLDASRGTWELNRGTGHASVSDFAIGLEHLWTTGQVVPGDQVLVLGFTTGMEAACAVLEITARPTDTPAFPSRGVH
ncbi:ketoacyl-ACP synthase III family protein [Streptomyces silaceus]|uniref:ketoacyl-ACP synthase III family protein n=1 Tax=Streptomyces silaceus TaxID=545123 RepID=UPI0006EB9807|nr:ketoacyl-ACP synthase III family protein [Streptomyces silaceus]